MLRSISLESQWKAEVQSGESLHFEQCKGGYFSTKEEYGLKLVGKTSQDSSKYVKAGTIIRCTGKNLLNGLIDGLYYASEDDNPRISTTTANLNMYRSIRVSLPSGVYTMSTEESMDIIRQGIDSVNSSNIANITSYKFTIEGTSGTVLFSIRRNTKEAFGDMKVQIESGDTATDYEPYCGNEITVPCDLYDGDVWYPTIGEVKRNNDIIERYDQTPIWAPQGMVNVTQIPTDLPGDLSATMLVHR